MSTTSARRFFKDLEACGLIDANQVAEIRRSNRKGSPLPVAQKLVASGTITKWQARKLLQGHTQFFHGKGNKYKLLRKIGRGGMGVVYKAEHVSIGRVVALKVMSAELMQSSRNVARFLREIQITATLDHPNIIRAYDADCDEGVHFLVMEYLRGRNLREWLESSTKRVGLETACDLILQAATGLQHVHNLELVHRDIKPSNLFLTLGPDGHMIVKMLDLGLSRLTSDSREDGAVTRAGFALGTLTYMAPEQIKTPRDADIRADIYALGSTLFELLTRRLPFLDANPVKMAMAKMKEEAPRVSLLRPEIPRELNRIVARMLAREPEKRYATPTEVVAALTEIKGKLARRKLRQTPPHEFATTSQIDSGFSDVSFVSPDASFEAVSTQDTLGIPESLTVELARLIDSHSAEGHSAEESPTAGEPLSHPESEATSESASHSNDCPLPTWQFESYPSPATPVLVPVHRAWLANIARVKSLELVLHRLGQHAESNSDDERTLSASNGKPSSNAFIPNADEQQESIRASMILQTWIALESFAGDLWEAALNVNPAWARTLGSASLDEMHKLSQGTYDLSGKMGTLLRSRFQFCTLRGIRETYAAVFHPAIPAIDSALAPESLDSLAEVRNQLLHRAGTLDDVLALKLVAPVFEVGTQLLEAIDAAICDSKLKADR